jgi:hypothetical protein
VLAARSVFALISALCFFSIRTIQAQTEPKPILSYQVGAFQDKENAERLATELFNKGFYGIVGQKTVRGLSLWAVAVLAPPNPFEDFQGELLAAGFPSFPIR